MYFLPLMKEHKFELVDVEYVKEAGTSYRVRILIKRAALQ